MLLAVLGVPYITDCLKKVAILCRCTNTKQMCLCEIAIKILAHFGCVLGRLSWLRCRVLAKFGHSR